MPITLFSFVDLYSRVLVGAEHLLTKGEEHAKAEGVSEAEMLDWRLIGDMQPLSFQLMVVCNFPRQWLARAAGRPVPDAVEANLTAPGFHAALQEAKAYLAAFTPEDFAGRDDVELTVNIGMMEPTFPVGQWVSVFATTNLYFHLSTAYGILRAHGVQIGKADLFAGRL